MSPTVTEEIIRTSRRSSRSVSAVCTYCSAMKTDWKSVSPVSFARPHVPPTAFISRPPKTPKPCGSAAASVTQRFITSITTVVFFCGYCVEACPTDAIIAARARLLCVASYNTSTLVYTKDDMLAPIPPGARPPVIRESAEASGH